MNKTEATKETKIHFPWRLYFQQLFAPNLYVKFINPFSFWRRYRINHLETCREVDTVQHLENCHQRSLSPTKTNQKKNPHNFKTTTRKPSIQQESSSTKKILIYQPGFELKYRGVTYCNHKIVIVDLDRINLKSQPLTLDSLEQSPLNHLVCDVEEV